eukprot:g24387.t1
MDQVDSDQSEQEGVGKRWAHQTRKEKSRYIRRKPATAKVSRNAVRSAADHATSASASSSSFASSSSSSSTYSSSSSSFASSSSCFGPSAFSHFESSSPSPYSSSSSSLSSLPFFSSSFPSSDTAATLGMQGEKGSSEAVMEDEMAAVGDKVAIVEDKVAIVSEPPALEPATPCAAESDDWPATPARPCAAQRRPAPIQVKGLLCGKAFLYRTPDNSPSQVIE